MVNITTVIVGNSGQDCLQFTLCLCSWERHESIYPLPSYKQIVGQTAKKLTQCHILHLVEGLGKYVLSLGIKTVNLFNGEGIL